MAVTGLPFLAFPIPEWPKSLVDLLVPARMHGPEDLRSSSISTKGVDSPKKGVTEVGRNTSTGWKP